MTGDSYEWHNSPEAEQRGATAREAGFGTIRTTGVGADRADGRPAFRVEHADPRILISDLMMDMIRDGPRFGAELDGDLLRFEAVNGTWVYRIGEHLEDRKAWVAEWPAMTLPVPMGSKEERADRIEAANIANKILYHLGEITALVPRGPLRDKADDEVEHIAELAEMIGRWKPEALSVPDLAP